MYEHAYAHAVCIQTTVSASRLYTDGAKVVLVHALQMSLHTLYVSFFMYTVPHHTHICSLYVEIMPFFKYYVYIRYNFLYSFILM
jgi:hypothetical protein